MTKMKIAFITPNLKMGGYERVVVNYANRLCELGHFVYILCGSAYGELIEDVHNGVHILNFNARARNFFFPLVSFLHSNRDTDVLYSAFRSYNTIAEAAKFAAFSRVSVMTTAHGFESNGLANNNFIVRFLANKATWNLAVSKSVADYEQCSLHLDKVLVAYNPVIDESTAIQDVAHPWFKDDIPIIINCGRLAKDKHQDLVIRILSEVMKKNNVRLMFLGDGPERERYEALVKELGVIGSVEFLGNVKSPMSYIQHAKLLLHTSEREGFGNVIVEALYCDIPVFVTDCGGPIEIIEGTDCGVNIGKIDNPNFVDNTAKLIIDYLDGKKKYFGMKKRSLDFTVGEATNRLERIMSQNCS